MLVIGVFASLYELLILTGLFDLQIYLHFIYFIGYCKSNKSVKRSNAYKDANKPITNKLQPENKVGRTNCLCTAILYIQVFIKSILGSEQMREQCFRLFPGFSYEVNHFECWVDGTLTTGSASSIHCYLPEHNVTLTFRFMVVSFNILYSLVT